VSQELSTAQAAERLGVTQQAIAKWIRQGLFPNAYKINPYGRTSPYRIPERDIEAFEEKRKERSSG
jgi:excisionase family DNA binding protein